MAGYGLTPSMLERIGASAVLCGNIEFWLERAIWELDGKALEGERPWTDGKPVSAHIEQLDALKDKISNKLLAELIGFWCKAAHPAFHCRNSILHGVALSFDGSPPSFLRNTLWDGVVRKRDPASFVADEHTLGLIATVYDVLLRGIILIEKCAQDESLSTHITQELVQNLQAAKSVASELSDLPAAMSHEKY